MWEFGSLGKIWLMYAREPNGILKSSWGFFAGSAIYSVRELNGRSIFIKNDVLTKNLGRRLKALSMRRNFIPVLLCGTYIMYDKATQKEYFKHRLLCHTSSPIANQ